MPDFAVHRLVQSACAQPGVAWIAWFGPGLELALARSHLGKYLELDPAGDSSQLVQSIEHGDHECIVWKNVEQHTHESLIRAVISKTGFEGTNILDNPSIAAPGWQRVSSEQLDLGDAVAMLSGDHRHRVAALVELDPRVLAPNDADEPENLDLPRDAYVRDLVTQMNWHGQRGPLSLYVYLAGAQRRAERIFGARDPKFLLVCRTLGLAAGAYASPHVADRYLAPPAEADERDREPQLAGSALEHSVVQTMLGRYEAALARFEAAPTTDSDHSLFQRFHQLTHAALGHTQLPDVDQSPLSSRVTSQGQALLRHRLARFNQP